jgi:hypothetical protein
MDHLEFCNVLDTLGINVKANNLENEERIFDCSTDIFGTKVNKIIKQRNFILTSETNPDSNLLKMLLKKAIDLDEWKHSLYIDIVPDNYDLIKEIIQKKIIDRAIEIDELTAIYFQLQYEFSKDDSKEK